MSEKRHASQPVNAAEISHWDYETDVAIVGYGGAGACAAIEAADLGAEVLLIEAASDGGGSTEMSSAEIYMGGNGGTRVQRATGHEEDTANMKAYLMAAFGDNADEAKVEAYCEGSVDHFNWLVDKGVPFKDSEYKQRAIMALTDDCLLFTSNEKAHPFREKARPMPRGHNLHIEGDNGGPLFFKIMRENIAKRDKVTVKCETRALTLVKDGNAVVGLLIRENMEEKAVRARKGVILCAGGFTMNEEMIKQHAPLYAHEGLHALGNPGDNGVGILMGQGAGGGLVNMSECFVTVPYYPPATLTFGIFVNSQGQRFINEDCYHGRVGDACLRQMRTSPRVYLITDVEAYADYEKMSYLGAQVAGTGESIEELAEELGINVTALSSNFNFYNEHAAKGEDPLFHKQPEWLRKLEPPYVALDVTPGNGAFYPRFTLGGLDTLPSGEVLTPERETIPGLYAAGRNTAGIPRTAAGYGSGMSVGDATFFGRMAGISAASRSS